MESSEKSGPVRVIIVDDTRSIRTMIRAMLETSPAVKVVGEAGDPYEARDLIRKLRPDVITLDVVMPRMDGLSFLERLMRLRPMPVVMVSNRTTEHSDDAITALSLGAVDCLDLGYLRKTQNADALTETVLMAAQSQPVASPFKKQVQEPGDCETFDWNGNVVLIGSSTGGVDALLQVLSEMPVDCPPIVIAQHMPKLYLGSFANRLQRTTRPIVRLSEHGNKLERGQVYLAAGGENHTVISRRDAYAIKHEADDGSEVFVPSVNRLFNSGVVHAERMVGVILTGMGCDGADALLRMREAGAYTIAQDGASSVVDGMPRAAREIGAAVEVASLSRIGERILARTSQGRGGRV